MKTLSFKFEQLNTIKKQGIETLETISFETNGNLCIDAKADNLQRTINFCSELFNLLDVMKQSGKALVINGCKFYPNKDFNLYAIIDGKEHFLEYSSIIQFDAVAFKVSAPTLRTNKEGQSVLNTNSRKAFALQVWQLLQGAEGKTQLMHKTNLAAIDAKVNASSQFLLA